MKMSDEDKRFIKELLANALMNLVVGLIILMIEKLIG